LPCPAPCSSSRGLGPDVGATYGIKEIATGTDLTGTLQEVVSLQYDPVSDTNQAGGIRGYLTLPPTGSFTRPFDLVGHDVLLWGDVIDTCHATPVHAEATARVTGLD
jgi:hypothetical protein